MPDPCVNTPSDQSARQPTESDTPTKKESCGELAARRRPVFRIEKVANVGSASEQPRTVKGSHRKPAKRVMEVSKASTAGDLTAAALLDTPKSNRLDSKQPAGQCGVGEKQVEERMEDVETPRLDMTGRLLAVASPIFEFVRPAPGCVGASCI